MGTEPDGRMPSRRMASGAHVNVPGWPTAAPVLDRSARTWFLFDLGGQGSEVVREWQNQAGCRSVSRLPSWRTPDDDAPYTDALASLVRTARVGDRVAAAGPEADVYYWRALAIGAGFLECEIEVHATSRDEIRARCAHCASVTRVRARPGDSTRCTSCGYDEVVHHHFSRRIGAYLTFRADAEAPR